MSKVLILKTAVIAGLLMLLAFVAPQFFSHPNDHISNKSTGVETLGIKATVSKDKIDLAKAFINRHNYNERYVFFCNMTLPSGNNRFFVYDLKKDSVSAVGLVTHGNCNQYWLEGRRYGNTIGCGCTSLGKYKIGKSYYGKFGLAYKLFGLDSSNNNAFERYVVLHSHPCVPDKEVKDDICQSNGCPTVNPAYLKKLQAIIDASSKPILLWIYN